jgi:DNA-binding response OmpR family regulator
VKEPLFHGSTRQKFVLLVEDDAAVRRSLMLALVDHGFQILQASSGDEGMRVAENLKETIEVAVVDMALPPIWGDEFAQRLALVSPLTQFIFISGHSEDFLRLGGNLTGNEIFFPKPFSPKLLLEKIRDLLGIAPPVVQKVIGSTPTAETLCPQPPHFAEYLDLHIETDQRVD